MVSRDTAIPKPQNLTEAENVIEAVKLLHELAYDAATIARNLHIDQATTLHILEHGRLPQRQMHLAWKVLPEVES